MVSGVPRMCMRITPTPASATTGVSSGSKARPATSFTTAAPAAMAARATGALRVSTEIGPSRRRASCSITGTTRAISSSTVTGVAPGRVDSPPTSSSSQPSAMSRSAWAMARSTATNRPPSENESGVTLMMPTMTGWSSASRWPAISHAGGGSACAASRRPKSGPRRSRPAGTRSGRASGASRLAAAPTSAHPAPVSTSAPAFAPQCTSASRSASEMSSRRTTSGCMPVAANHAGWASQPRATSAARTASGVWAASAVTFTRRRARAAGSPARDRGRGSFLSWRRRTPAAASRARAAGPPAAAAGRRSPAPPTRDRTAPARAARSAAGRRLRRRGRGRRDARGQRPAGVHQLHLVTMERLALEQRARQPVERRAMAGDDGARALVRLGEDALELRIHDLGGAIGDLAPLHHLAAEEDLGLAIAHGDRADDVAHAELRHHAPRHFGRLLDVLRGAGGDFLGPQHQLLRDPAAVRHREPADDVLLGVVVPVLFREREGDAERSPARHDPDLIERVETVDLEADERVACLVIRRETALLVREHHALALEAEHHLVLGVLEVVHVHGALVAAGGEEGRLVDDVRQLGAGQTRRSLGDALQVHTGRERNLAGVDPQDLLPALHVGHVHYDLPVEPARAQQCRVEDVRPVGGGEQDHAVVRLEAVHFDEQLIQRLLALVVPPAEPRAAVAPDGVDLVDEDDAGRVGLALLEQVAHP